MSGMHQYSINANLSDTLIYLRYTCAFVHAGVRHTYVLSFTGLKSDRNYRVMPKRDVSRICITMISIDLAWVAVGFVICLLL